MKKTFFILFWLTAITTLTGSNCKKENNEPQLPAETQTGANTLGFKINGKVYTASGKSGLLTNQHVWGGGPFSDTSIDIGASNSNLKFYFRITIKYSGNIGLHYTLANTTYNGIFQDNSDGTIPGNSNFYQTNDVYKGIVNIKFTNATINPLRGFTILAGTFEMEAVNGNGQVIKITDGRFDIDQ